MESFIEGIQKSSPPFEKGGREGFLGMRFQKAKQSNHDADRIERYQRVILALPENQPFRKADIFEAIKEDFPIYIGRVINELTQDGFLRKSKADKKYSWTNKKNIFNIDTWVKHRVLSPTVTRSPSLDRPRERLLRLGPSELKTAELLAVLIRSGLQGESAVQAGEKLASVFGNDLQKISSQGMGELKQISRADGAVDYVSSKIVFRTKDGRELEPQDYLKEFERFVKGNPQHIEALKVLLNRPQEFDTRQLKTLRESLSVHPDFLEDKFTEKNLRRAYNKELADIISLIRHAGRGTELLTPELRVGRALEKLRSSRSFTAEQEKWLALIRRHLIENLLMEEEDIEHFPIFTREGVSRVKLDRIFQGNLKAFVHELNLAIVF